MFSILKSQMWVTGYLQGFCRNAEDQEQPSPISVLELQFEDNDHASGYPHTAKSNEHGN